MFYGKVVLFLLLLVVVVLRTVLFLLLKKTFRLAHYVRTMLLYKL